MKLSVTSQRILAHIFTHGPATKLELSEACCAVPSTICVCLRNMRNAQPKMIYKSSWRKTYQRGGIVAPLYALGSEPDAPRPPISTSPERRVKYTEKVRGLLGDELAKKVINHAGRGGAQVLYVNGYQVFKRGHGVNVEAAKMAAKENPWSRMNQSLARG